MKKIRIALITAFSCIMATSLIGLVACTDTDIEPEEITVGKIQGTVMDSNGTLLEDVEIYYNDDDDYVESNQYGKFEIGQITIAEANLTLTANLKGYEKASRKVTQANFDADGIYNVTFVLSASYGTIRGNVFKPDSEEGVEGLRVYIDSGISYYAQTDAEGYYEIKNVPVADKMKVYVAEELEDGQKQTYELIYRNINKRMFAGDENIATVNFELSELDLDFMPGIRPRDLDSTPLPATKTSIRGQKEIADYFGISRDSLQGSSKTETHNEGFCLNADTVNLDETSTISTYIYARVKIDENHKYLTAYARMFANQNNEGNNGGRKAQLGLYAIDEEGNFLNEDKSKDSDTTYPFGKFTEITTESFMPVTFDLSAYEGQTLMLILGTRTGYHCVIDRVVFNSSEPTPLKVTGVNGISELAIYEKVTDKSFDVDGLKSKWNVGGATDLGVSAGIQLNSGDPWKAIELDTNNPQPINSYMYVTTDITAEASTFKVHATIVDITQIRDPGQGGKEFPPYISVILISKNGSKLYQSDWTQINAEHNNQPFDFEFDFSDYVGENITVVIAANVGYRATITGAEFVGDEEEAVTPGVDTDTDTDGNGGDPDDGGEPTTGSGDGDGDNN